MKALAGQRVLLGVTGSIAAYKTPHLVRCLVAAGAEVQVVLSAAGSRFVAPMALAAVSGHPVRDDLWDASAELNMGHIELARWADVILIAPASADVLARLANGLADDLLTTLCLASTAELWLAPAMNHVMWAHPATCENMARLLARGARCIGPETGELAEREVGAGRMSAPETICEALTAGRGTSTGSLAGRRVVVTAGPTREAIDPVRYITNHSSGRMGYALAAAAAAAGAEVTLVSGPTTLAAPCGVQRIDVASAAEMHASVMDAVPEADVFIGAAAVADYRPAEIAEHKIKKAEGDAAIALTRTRDIIADVAARFPRVFTLGFAAETRDVAAAARDKRRRKGLGMIAGNLVGPDDAFGRDDNALVVVWTGGERTLARASKRDLADQLVAMVADALTGPRGG
ncbi:bifunctional phosphopantothenoylcysteine decarboxylase/phosphopantothenate--cysteine ligase CoaBC [Salinisphaera sp. Q1T1-3]|uniref:bifunctional phosphopantothenoylcysteine decarboxylase/phosphopantothenate--cysteine ligase CoaBC n=1 Tax=Salinisphaera sp. Q1T1-3 TaxID=2321229 RepID=UPI000E75DFFB|nr:bifunctional phosphopantothenoylcysteine decarboxylase/phosphopantothenate--cysteine ligase CoaBC [Salinisphaera sp. Q1T1-3]RJS94165.1 bifunctional phosphopantothenoylcysteine decarboxylase/phosphopantothenate--cysteine ligase CoaBC [Salinisphaera sp. Q1T1-3]